MESLLASIRKAIDSDIGKNSKSALPVSQDTPFKGAMRELRVKFDDNLSKPRDASAEISELRSKIQKNRGSAGIAEPIPRLPNLPSTLPPPTPSPASKSGFAGILGGDAASVPWAPRVRRDEETPSLRPTIQDHLPASRDYQGSYEETAVYPEEVGWVEDEPAFVPAAPLMSTDTANSANSSFNQLADTLMARALGERSIEDMTQDLLKGMLRSWLDAHLPSLVEKLVREEIERVARRGR
jgi:cell pole-organizing protein PopZ